jgi:hypothetical protein
MSMSAVARIAEVEFDDEVETLRRQLKEAHLLARRVHVTLLGVRADAVDAFGPVRLKRAEDDLKNGITDAQRQLDALEAVLVRA